MTLIEGVGDEVTHFVVVMLVVIVGLVAWWSTSISEQPLIRTVLILEPHRHRSISTVAAAAMTAAAAAQDTGQSEPIVLTESDLEVAASGTTTSSTAGSENKSPTSSTGVQTQEAAGSKAGTSSGPGAGPSSPMGLTQSVPSAGPVGSNTNLSTVSRESPGGSPTASTSSSLGTSTDSTEEESGAISNSGSALVVPSSGSSVPSMANPAVPSENETTWLYHEPHLRRRHGGSTPSEEMRSRHLRAIQQRLRMRQVYTQPVPDLEMLNRIREHYLSHRAYTGEADEEEAFITVEGTGDDAVFTMHSASEVGLTQRENDPAAGVNAVVHSESITRSNIRAEEQAGSNVESAPSDEQCSCTTSGSGKENSEGVCEKINNVDCKCASSSTNKHSVRGGQRESDEGSQNAQDTNSRADDRTQEQSANTVDDIRIRLKYLNDNQKLVQGKLQEQLGDFKRRHFGVELDGNKVVRLIFNGQVLHSDDRTLQNYGLFDNCVVHCLVHPQRSASPTAREGRTSNAGEESSNPNPVIRDWDLSHLLYSMIGILLALGWYFRFYYPQLFSATSTITLIGLSGVFAISVVGMYLPDHDGIRT